MRVSTHPDHLRVLFVAILIAALVSSHWQGLAHRIGHASRMLGGAEAVELAEVALPALALAASASDADASPALPLDTQGAGHSCLAFDAATIGAFLCTSPFVIDVPRNAPVMAQWIAFLSYLAPFTAHFSSRAPPASR